MGYHLVSFKLTIQGAVLYIDGESFYRHGFLTHNDYTTIYQEGNLPYFSNFAKRKLHVFETRFHWSRIS